MLDDALGNPVSTDNPATIRAIDIFVSEFLGYGKNLPVILKAASEDPTCCLANAMAAQLMLFLESAEGPKLALPFVATARKAATQASPRERAFLSMIEAALAGAPSKAVEIARDMALRWPRDLNANKLGQYHAFNRGDLAGMLDLVEKILPANRDNHYVHGMHAFGLEQANRLAEADEAGRRAVAMDRRDPWAHHAVAHVLITEGRTEEGVRWLESHADTWVDCNSFMLTHNWWHAALFRLDLDDPAGALAIYDRWVWGQDKTYSQDQVNAISLLWRLELHGAAVGDRWQDVADHVAGRTREHVLPFLDLHYIYALARAGREAKAKDMSASIAAHAAISPDRSWREVALSAFRGVLAHARGRFAEASAKLAPVQPFLQYLGGSHAQRDLFVETWVDATIRAGSGKAIRPLLEERCAARPGVAWHRRDLDRAVRT